MDKRYSQFKKIIAVIYVAIPFYVFSPTFFLALTGDDYLGYWRITNEIGKDPYAFDLLKYFFTDYGPQDIFTFLIQKVFGFTPIFYYSLAFILRLVAGYSLYKLILHTSKSRKVAYMSSLLFVVSYAGLETNDWSFNMPSFISIVFINLHLLYLLRLIESKGNKFKFKTFTFLLLSIVFQPIRALFMPFLTLGIILIAKLYNNKISSIKIITFIFICLALTYILITFTKIGSLAGIPENFNDRLSLRWKTERSFATKEIPQLLNRGNYTFLITPISQFGSVTIPFTIIPSKTEVITNFETLILFTLFSFIFNTFTIKLFIKLKYNNIVVLNTLWSTIILIFYRYYYTIPINIVIFLQSLFGGYFLALIGTLLLKSERKFRFLVLISITGLFLSFAGPYLRNPLELQPAHIRYLIITVNFWVLLLSILIAKTKIKCMGLILIGFLVLINAHQTYKYFAHLSVVRNEKIVKNIRNKIEYNLKFENKEIPLLYFFETDNDELLYHSVIFGFPIMFSIEGNYTTLWHVAYTRDWNEVVNAYRDGSGVERFKSVPVKPVEIENIYSYELKNNELVETTEKTRSKLRSITASSF